MRTAAIVLAGGSGSRLGGDLNKSYAEVAGHPLLWYSLVAMERASVEEVVLVVRPSDRERARATAAEAGTTKISAIVDGGDTRTASEHSGLTALDDSGHDVIMIHDAARPFVTPAMIDRLAGRAFEVGGAVPVLEPVIQPWWSDGEHLRTAGSLVRAQTPQAFRAAPLLAAHARAMALHDSAADTAEILHRHGDIDIAAVEGDPRAFKVTFEEDLGLAAAVASAWTRAVLSSDDNRAL